MVLKVLGSGSQGNCYILDDGNEALILEAGVRFMEVKKALKFNIRKVVGCLITHRHNDHAKYIKDMVGNGFHTLALQDVWEAKNVWDSRSIVIEQGKGYRFGKFKVIPFTACHDVPCVGYLIEHPKCGKIFFLTDSYMCEYVFNGANALNHILVECNYSDECLVEAISAGRTLQSQRERLLTSHMELSTCIDFLRNNDISNVSEIVLLHLSDNNSNESFFVSEVEKSTGKATYAAYPGLEIELNKL